MGFDNFFLDEEHNEQNNGYDYTQDLWLNNSTWIDQSSDDAQADTLPTQEEYADSTAAIDPLDDVVVEPSDNDIAISTGDNAENSSASCGDCKQDVDWSSEDYRYDGKGYEIFVTDRQDNFPEDCDDDCHNSPTEDYDCSKEKSGSFNSPLPPASPDCTMDFYKLWTQAKSNCLSNGQGKILKFSFDKKAYYIIENPVDASNNLFLNACYHTNLSSCPIKVNIYMGKKISDTLAKSDNVLLNASYGNASKTNIFFGNSPLAYDGTRINTLALPPYSTFLDDLKGCVLLAPGNCYIVELASIKKEDFGCCISSFNWQELPTSHI
ncbi:MAG: DUF6143 family protein [Oscillospiraceae bacterium]